MKQNQTKMCRLREKELERKRMGLILLKSFISRNCSVNLAVKPKIKQIGGRIAFLFSTKELFIIIITFAI